VYHHPDGAGVVMIESRALLHARLKASLAMAIEDSSSCPGISLTRSGRVDPGKHDRQVSH
jgi:hypothetical protein